MSAIINLKDVNKNNFQVIKLSLQKPLLQSSSGTASFDLGTVRKRRLRLKHGESTQANNCTDREKMQGDNGGAINVL